MPATVRPDQAGKRIAVRIVMGANSTLRYQSRFRMRMVIRSPVSHGWDVPDSDVSEDTKMRLFQRKPFRNRQGRKLRDPAVVLSPTGHHLKTTRAHIQLR